MQAGEAVAELQPIDAALVPGRDVPALWTDDVTAVGGIAVGWVKAADGTFAAPAVDLAALRMLQSAMLSAQCQASIFASGFPSSALGAVHGYPSDQMSQLNLLASVSASLLPSLPAGWTTPFMCADSTGAWAFRDHTAAQIQQVGTDAKAVVLAARQKLATLSAQVAAATTAAAIAAIAWA